MQTQLLDGTWSLSSVDPSAIVNNCSYFSNINRIDIDIPGDVHSTLLDRGFIKDPYYASDELSTLWVGQNDWKIERDFTYKKSEKKVILSLNLKGNNIVRATSLAKRKVKDNETISV